MAIEQEFRTLREKVSDLLTRQTELSVEKPSESPRATDRRALGGGPCNLGSHVPPELRWRASHIVLEPAINPLTGELLLDGENRPVYNQVYEPWEPSSRARTADTVAAAAGVAAAAVCVAIASENRAAIRAATYERRVAALESDNSDLRLKLRLKTAEADQFEQLHEIFLATAEDRLMAERSRIDQFIAERRESHSSSEATVLMVKEGFATLGTALEARGERVDRLFDLVEPLVVTLGRLFERQAPRSYIRSRIASGGSRTLVKVKSL